MHRHFILFKPYGYVSQFVSETKKKKVLGELYDFPEGTMAIGRLDEASEGLLLLTTDGKVSEQVRSSSVEKEYYAQVDGLITEEALRQLRKGIMIRTEKELHQTKPCQVRKLEEAPALPERARNIFVLNRFEELSGREIAIRLGISQSLVEKEMIKAIAYLRGRLG